MLIVCLAGVVCGQWSCGASGGHLSVRAARLAASPALPGRGGVPGPGETQGQGRRLDHQGTLQHGRWNGGPLSVVRRRGGVN